MWTTTSWITLYLSVDNRQYSLLCFSGLRLIIQKLLSFKKSKYLDLDRNLDDEMDFYSKRRHCITSRHYTHKETFKHKVFDLEVGHK